MRLQHPAIAVCVMLGLVLAVDLARAQQPGAYPPTAGSFPPVSGAGTTGGYSPMGSYGPASYAPPGGIGCPSGDCATAGPITFNCGPKSCVYGSAEWLFMTRTHALGTPTPIIAGPDSISFKSDPISYRSGYRLRLGVESCNGWGIEGAFNDFGGWNNTVTGALTAGLAFDDGINAGNPWAGANFVDPTTYFTPAALASFANVAGGNETTEYEGLGPNTAFADAPPTYTIAHQSNMWTVEANMLNLEWNNRVQYGFGYLHAQVIENASATLTGTFRAADNGLGAPNGGLSDPALLSPFGGALTLISGNADGWDDESGVSGNPGPDTLSFLHAASTQNYLNGGQGVLRLVAVDNPRWMLDIAAKAGVYHNRARGVITERYSGLAPNDNSVYGRDYVDTKDAVSFVGMTGLGGAFKFNEMFRITGGYDVWYISGVALASDQVRGLRGGTYQLQTNGTFIAHGCRAGMELRY